jgi:hypothetical protein
MDKLDWFSRAKMTAGLVLLVISGTLSAGMPVAAVSTGLKFQAPICKRQYPRGPQPVISI